MNTDRTPAPACALRTLALILSSALLFNQCAATAFAQATSSSSSTPQAPPSQQAPVPPQIASARSILLVNDGADANFPVPANEAYNDVYAALQAWGHFKLVTTPDQADLVFQLQDVAPITGVGGDANYVYSITGPAFRLAIKDPKTNVTLWTITSPVDLAGRSAARARWFNIAVTNLVSRIKVLANQPLTNTETADLTLYPHHHGLAFGITLGAIVLGAGVATGLIMKHEFDQKVANQNAALCAQNTFFCTTPTP
ncbi:MAG: hypothetical protein WBY53_09480 [Acidobacteriaceae bacterium]